MRYAFHTHQRYSRKDVLRDIGVPDADGGVWYTGYASHKGDYFLFCNVGTEGRTGHNYENRWEDSDLIWYAKTGTHIGQPGIQQLIDGSREIYLFWRSDNSAPFAFAGLVRPIRVTTTCPVRIRWQLCDGKQELTRAVP